MCNNTFLIKVVYMGQTSTRTLPSSVSLCLSPSTSVCVCVCVCVCVHMCVDDMLISVRDGFC